MSAGFKARTTGQISEWMVDYLKGSWHPQFRTISHAVMACPKAQAIDRSNTLDRMREVLGTTVLYWETRPERTEEEVLALIRRVSVGRKEMRKGRGKTPAAARGEALAR